MLMRTINIVRKLPGIAMFRRRSFIEKRRRVEMNLARQCCVRIVEKVKKVTLTDDYDFSFVFRFCADFDPPCP
jgi:hypothetical protein